MSSRTLITCSSVSLLLVACASNPEAYRYDDVLRGERDPIEVEVDENIASACDLPREIAYFEEGSDWLDDRDKSTILRLASCMRQGPLRDRSILLTGHTDRSGADMDNLELGRLRAQAVAAELRSDGVAAERIYVRSRGERDAQGSDGSSLPRDRNVVLTVLEREM